MTFHVEIFDSGSCTFAGEFDGVLELGRQETGEPNAVSQVHVGGITRLIVADQGDNWIARRQLLVEPHESGTLRLINLSNKVDLRISEGEQLEASATRVVTMPAVIDLSATQQLSFSESESQSRLESLKTTILAPGERQEFSEGCSISGTLASLEDGENLEKVLRVLREAMEVFQNASTSEALYQAAVNGAVRVVGFDGARLLRYDDGKWSEKTRFLGSSAPVSQHVLEEVLKHRKTFWHSSQGNATRSLAKLETVIAAPILDRGGHPIGALYGERSFRPLDSSRRKIDWMGAQLMELLACGVASELARHGQEAESRRLQTQFEQFFSPQLARELEAQPDLLDGRDVDVSILFCDIRRFSRISENVGTQTIFEFINEVIGAISECVVKNGGVVVDYVGDAVMGMFGAPQAQSDHAERACRAALEMLGRLPELNSRWNSRIIEEIDLAIGINSGPARAGNAGSDYKYKYGPLGNTVNLASRVQGATKHLKTRILICRSTAESLNASFPRRKVCDVRVVNIQEPVGLYELSSGENSALNQAYRQALERFETGEFRNAASQLGQLLDEFPDDGPTLVLLSRVVNAIVDGRDAEHPVWCLQKK